ncbi:MAG: transcription termination/antitermination protein NusG [Brevinematia bacterium]
MGRAWYVLHTISGHENNVVEKIKKDIVSKEDFKKVIVNIKIPMESVEIKQGDKKLIKKKKIFPGYVLMELDLPDDNQKLESFLRAIKSIHGVIGFLGSKIDHRTRNISFKEPPKPLSLEEVRAIFEKSGEFKSKAFIDLSSSFEPGDQVRIIDGPFKGLVGIVTEVYPDKYKLKVTVSIFNRKTPLNIGFEQVEKM